MTPKRRVINLSWFFSYKINPLLLTRLVKLRQLNINFVIFSIFVDLYFDSVNKIMKNGTRPVYSHLDLTLAQ